jgi:D-glycero-alpha-D-manno-heptose-7-phosphate kinase
MYSVDLDLYEEATSITDIEYNGTMDLVKAACAQQGIAGIEITTQSDAPPGSGLGTSASLGVAVLGALSTYTNQRYGMKESYAEKAYLLETEELKLLSGTQDQYAAAFGGFNCFRCRGNQVDSRDNLNIVDPLFYELEKRLVLIYTGKSRLSSSIHTNVVESFNKGENHVALRNLVTSGELAREALLTRNIDKLADAINMSWIHQKLLHDSVTNEQIESLFEIAKYNGMMAGKACGAGGGGCLLFLAERGKEHSLKKAVEARGVKVLNFKFDFSGLQMWELFE